MSFLTVDKNETKRPVAEFLAGNGYDFGFATYNNANIITELTNGEVEIGNIGDPEHLEYFKWSSPMKYYEEGYHAGGDIPAPDGGGVCGICRGSGIKAGRKGI